MISIANNSIPIADILAYVAYDPETGEATRLKTGEKIGYVSVHGYVVFRYKNTYVRRARLAFAAMTGEWPIELVDHINHDRADDRWCNLRQATISQNMRNRKGVGLSPYKGVAATANKKNPWRAWCKRDKKIVNLGVYPTQKLAALAHDLGVMAYHGEFARLNFPEECASG